MWIRDMGCHSGLGLNCFLLGVTDSGEQDPDLGLTGPNLGSGVVFFVSKNQFFMSADISSRHQVAIFYIGL
jgi:hypothetical protein